MSIDIAALQTFTAADLLKLCEHNIAQIHAGGQAYGMNGRQMTKADLKDLYEQRDKLKAEVAAENGDTVGGGIALASFGNPY